MPATQTVTINSAAYERALSALKRLVCQSSGIDLDQINVHATFLESGVDSLLLIQTSQKIREAFGVEISFRQLLEEVTTIDALAAYIAERKPPEETIVEPVEKPVASDTRPDIPSSQSQILSLPTEESDESRGVATNGDERRTLPQTLLERVVTQQLQLMAKQLDALRHSRPTSRASAAKTAPSTAASASINDQPMIESAATGAPATEKTSTAFPPASALPAAKVDSETYVPYHQLKAEPSAGLTAPQQEYLDSFSARYTKRTAGSKRLAQAYRPFLSDARATLGFRRLWKELIYPIVAECSSGSRFWDVDGNEYVDLTMGFGVNLFGHSPHFISEALDEQYRRGIHIGPQSPLAGKVAELICELTGMERVGFFNSGTEAVMVALRLARAITGRNKIALFAGAYHGSFDGVLVRTMPVNGTWRTVPLAPGVTPSMAEDVMVLNYDRPESLEILKAHAHELAAVLVEPVQSRRPDVQPREFLQELRRITEATGTALIFDEVITGFRVHPGGAQALFDVQADIVTYGKVIGGGLPIGVVAGRAAYMDAIDGGMWAFGDASYPRSLQTMATGTFSKHPLAMAGAWAVLNHLKSSGPTLQQELNERTSNLAERLNSYFAENGLPIRVPHFGSLFICRYPRKEKLLDLLFFHLIEKGVYIWEGRTCFLSTAHSDEDIAFVFEAFKESVAEMRAAGLLTGAPPRATTGPFSFVAAEQRLDDAVHTAYPSEPAPHEAKVSASVFNEETVEAAEPVQTVPLTEGQKEIWLVTQLGEDASRAYNESITLHLHGSLNLAAMRTALQSVVSRHDALRITFSPDGEQQQIHPVMIIEASLHDLTHVYESERESQVSALLASEAQRPFDLVQGPLLRARIIRLEDKYHLLVLTIHHIVTDGWSFGIVLRELRALYAAECQENACQLPEPMPFCEYALRESTQQQKPQVTTDDVFWFEKFSDAVPVMDLPLDHPRPPVQTYNGAVQHSTIDAALRDELKLLSEQQGSTLFMTLLAGFQALLHRLTGQDDIVIGVAAAGQLAVQGTTLVGYCINMLPLRSKLNGDSTFAEYMSSVRKNLLDAHDHQNFLASRLLKQLNLKRDPSRLPIFTVVFNLDQSQPISFFDLQVEVNLNPNGSSKFDLFFNVTDTPTGLLVDCEYNPDLFEQHTIKRWTEYYQTLLSGVAANPESRSSELPLMSEAERFQLLSGWNNTRNEYSGTDRLHELFEAQVELTPDAAAVIFEDEQLTYRELNRRANQLAHHLRRLGVGRGDVVGICMERSPEMVLGLLAILKAGGAYLPLDPKDPRERLTLMLEDAQSRLVLTQERLPARLPDDTAQLLYLDADAARFAQEPTDNPVSEVTAEDLAYVIYTSGSTGRPKGVMNTHGGICNRLLWMQDAYQLTADDRVLQKTRYSFDVSVWEFFWPLITGASLVLARPAGHQDSAYLALLIAEQQITTLHFVPSMLQVFIGEQGLEQCTSVRRVVCSGEALPFEVQEQFFVRHGAELYNLYGPTEAAVDVTHWRCERGTSRRTVPIGRPIANTRMYVLDAGLRPVPPGVTGELFIGGRGLARGYLKRPELTAERFIPDAFADEPGTRLYRTGDVARHLPGGELEFVGRVDHQVKVRGFRVETGEIEVALRAQEGVREAVVITREETGGGKRLVAYVVSEAGHELSGGSLRAALHGGLPDYMVPAAFVVMGELPLTANGKLDRSALPEPDQARPELGEAYVAPRTPLEETLCAIWSEVLSLERVGVFDNFFDLGGHSLLATGIISRLRTAFQLEISMRRIFEAPTVAALSVAIVQEMLTQKDGQETGNWLTEIEQLPLDEMKV